MARGVIFDMDGVLVNRDRRTGSWRAVARQYGIDLTDEAFERTFGMSSREIVQIWGPQITDEVRRIDDERADLPRPDSTTFRFRPGTRKRSHGSRRVTCWQWAPQARRRIWSWCCASGLGPYFAATVNGLEVSHGKPAPDIFLKAAERGTGHAGLRRDRDARSASGRVRAGMKAIGYVGTHPANGCKRRAVRGRALDGYHA